MRHKCYQIDDFISPFFEEKEVTFRLYDANLEPIDKIIKYGDFPRSIKYQSRMKLKNDKFFKKVPLYKHYFWKGKIYYTRLDYEKK